MHGSWTRGNISHARTREGCGRVPIDVLLRADCLCDGALAVGADVWAERELNEDAADCVVVVEFPDDVDDVLDAGLGGECDVVEGDADLLRGADLHADVDGGVGAGAGLDDGELGLEARVGGLEGGDAGCDAIADGPGRAVSGRARRKERETCFAMAVPSMRDAEDVEAEAMLRGWRGDKERRAARIIIIIWRMLFASVWTVIVGRPCPSVAARASTSCGSSVRDGRDGVRAGRPGSSSSQLSVL